MTERSEALPGRLLTSRDDVRVQKEYAQDDGVDLLVSIDAGERLSTRLFVVQVRGRFRPTPTTGGRTSANSSQGRGAGPPPRMRVRRERPRQLILVRLGRGADGRTQGRDAFLRDAEFLDLDPAAVAEIVERVEVWYDARPRQLVPTTNGG